MTEKKYFIEADTFKELIQIAYEKDDEVWSSNWHLKTDRYEFIDVKHMDGSIFHIRSSFYKLCSIFKHQLECFVVFSEHNGILAFCKDDLEYFKVTSKDEVTIIHEEENK